MRGYPQFGFQQPLLRSFLFQHSHKPHKNSCLGAVSKVLFGYLLHILKTALELRVVCSICLEYFHFCNRSWLLHAANDWFFLFTKRTGFTLSLGLPQPEGYSSTRTFLLFLRDVFPRQIGLLWREGNSICLLSALLGITRPPGTNFYLFPDPLKS